MTARVRISAGASAGLSLVDARSALYSWLQARHEGGVLVLTLADTTGQPPGSTVQALCDDLHWLGLDWDEGPYLQSERAAAYHRYAERLVRSDVAPSSVLLAADGTPSPVLAAVVDDHELGITHVIQDHGQLPGMAAYLLLCHALGWTPPTFAHLPALSFDDASTRPASVQACREQGYLGLALANDLARMGWTPRGKRQLLSMAQLAARFDLSRVARGPVTPAPGQLDWFNRRCLDRLDPAERARLMAEWWQRAYGLADRAQGTDLAPGEWQQTLASVVSAEVHALAEVPGKVRFAFVDPVERDARAAEMLSRPYAAEVLSAFCEGISRVEPFTYEAIDATISALRRQYKAALGIRSRDVLHVIRAALAGRVDAPCVVAVCQLLGRARCQHRALQALRRAQEDQRAQEDPQCPCERPGDPLPLNEVGAAKGERG